MKISLAFLLASTTHGFIVPAEIGVVVDKLVDTIPPLGTTDPLELATKTAVVPLILYAPFSRQSMDKKHVPVPAEDEIDFDAPIERQLQVDHVVRRQPFTIGLGDQGTFTPPSFLQQALGLYEPEKKFTLPVDDMDEHFYTLVHDECYLGKDLTAPECVDFDPMHLRY